MANYRANVVESVASADGTVHFDCWIQRQNGATWVNVPHGHRTIVLQATAILLITQNSSLTDAQKRQQLSELFRLQAGSWGIDESDEADGDIMALLPIGSWPVNVAL